MIEYLFLFFLFPFWQLTTKHSSWLLGVVSFFRLCAWRIPEFMTTVNLTMEARVSHWRNYNFFLYWTLSLGGGWDLGAFNFKMLMALEIKKATTNKAYQKPEKNQRHLKSYFVLVSPREACMGNVFELLIWTQ